ncbi:MAG: transposase [Sandaracinaceae bacterium]|nr:transposase [Sandaracinaceae bacterium]
MSKQAGSQGRGSSGRGGWRRWTPEDGADAVARWRASGLTAKEFAAQEGVSAQRLHRWSKQQVDTSSPPLSTPSPEAAAGLG